MFRGEAEKLRGEAERQQPEIHLWSLVPRERESTEHTHGLSVWALPYLQHWNLFPSQQILRWLQLLLDTEQGLCRWGGWFLLCDRKSPTGGNKKGELTLSWWKQPSPSQSQCAPAKAHPQSPHHHCWSHWEAGRGRGGCYCRYQTSPATPNRILLLCDLIF